MPSPNHFFFVSLLIITLFSCAPEPDPTLFIDPEKIVLAEKFEVNNFPNILPVYGVPKTPEESGFTVFSDQGAWHTFMMAPPKEKSMIGGFIGPQVLTQNNGEWISKQLMRLFIFDFQKKRKLNLAEAQNNSNNSYPGMLSSNFTIDSILVNMEMVYLNKRTNTIQLNVSNLSSRPKNLQIGWEGVLFKDYPISSHAHGIEIVLSPTKTKIYLTGSEQLTDTKIDQTRKSYALKTKAKTINPKESQTSFWYLSTCFNGQELETQKAKIQAVQKEPSLAFKDREERWNNYLNLALNSGNENQNFASSRKLVVKSIQTLMTNWRSPAGQIKNDGFFPSVSVNYFHGFWAWDSWKHAAALSYFEPELAKNQMKAMYAFQDENGMVADCFFRDTTDEKTNWRNTKPPLDAWAIYHIYKQTKDESFLKEMIPFLTKHLLFWDKYRKLDGQEWLSFGSTDGTLEAAKWESGMDNSARFDQINLVPSKGGALIENPSVDLNAQLILSKKLLAEYNIITNEPSDKTLKYSSKQEIDFNNHFFNPSQGLFTDFSNDKNIKSVGSEIWTPLWAGVSTQENAKMVKDYLLKPHTFNTHFPFPTLEKSARQFEPKNGYWRGPVWLDQANFAVKGLRNYGFKKEADEMTEKIFKVLNEGENAFMPLYENYNPLTGKGQNAPNFSWTAAHIILLYHNQ